MIQRLRAVPRPMTQDGEKPCNIRVIREQVRELDSSLKESSPRFQAALLLLGSVVIGQNTYRLASVTGLDARFVARCARRLVDNGVWSGGVTWSAWTDDKVGREVFWADVEVALGRACRRVGDEGALCWALPGEWWKPFELVSSPVSGVEIDYQVPYWQDMSASSPSSEDGRTDELSEDAPVDGVFIHATLSSTVDVSATSPAAGVDYLSSWKDVESSAFPDVVWFK